MQIQEPITLLTDYVLGAVALTLGVFLLRERKQKSVLFLALAFLAMALGAFVGGSWHGFRAYLGGTLDFVFWKVTVYCVGLTALFLISSVCYCPFRQPWRLGFLIFGAVQFSVYVGWMTVHDDFLYVLLDYMPALLLLLVAHAWRSSKPHGHGSGWIVAGVVTSFVAAGIQMSGIALHKHFNHNDLYHVLQTVALLLLYWGGRRLKDR